MPFDFADPALTRVLNDAIRKTKAPVITPEHFLLHLVQDKDVRQLLRRQSIETWRVIHDVNRHLRTLPNTRETPTALSGPLVDILENARQAKLTDGQQNLVTPVTALVSLLGSATPTPALDLLAGHGLTMESFKASVAAPPSGLKLFATELVARARAGHLDPVYGRDDEIAQTIQTLKRRKKNNPMLIGEAGVGKTAIVEGLALKIARGEVPEKLRNKKIYAIDMARIVGGTEFRGSFEDRLIGLVDELKNDPDAIAFIDEAHTMVAAGKTSDGSLDASNIMKPALADGSISCIGATTIDEFQQYFERDPALQRRFTKINIDEPTPDRAFAIADRAKAVFEKAHGCRYGSETAVRPAVDLSHRFIQTGRMPDKVLDVLDVAGAMLEDPVKQDGSPQDVTRKEIERAVAQFADLPLHVVSSSQREKLATLSAELQANVYGQPEAMERVTEAMYRATTNIDGPVGPRATMLFHGAHGSGMSRTVETLGTVLGMKTLTCNLGRAGALADLIKSVEKTSHAILHFTNADMAHGDVAATLVDIIKKGELKQQPSGKTVKFHNTIAVFTTALGHESKTAIGFDSSASSGNDFDKTYKAAFDEELRRAIKTVIAFGALDEPARKKIADGLLKKMAGDIAANDVTVEWSDGALTYLANHNFRPALGAASIENTLIDAVKIPVSREMCVAGGKLRSGGHVRLSTVANSNFAAGNADGLRIEYNRPPKEEWKPDLLFS